MVKISPSILSADFSILKDEVIAIEKAGADMLHIDVMDGNFVQNLTFGWKLVADIRKHTKLIFDTHLMINEPDKYIEDFAKAGADIITAHASDDLHKTISLIKKFNKKVGVALNPSVNENILEYAIDEIDLILIMSVSPGFGGQGFINSQLEKIKRVKKLVGNRNIEIEVDGGVKDTNARNIIDSGATSLVAGSFIFNSEDYKIAIDKLRNA
ncbi:MAG: ribulose-phosphate 3-epimerase [Rickettsiales bacterium]|jgi:ribulose-phosphate 3-epimerase|nr:ribulose-phosphate 3-epimerase [Rickettsiales bacterium]